MLVALLLIVFASILPAIFYSMLFFWADRFEREPLWLARVTFFWGALPAIAVSLIAEAAIGSPLVGPDNGLASELMEGAVVAPMVEEIAKAVALLGIYWLWRQEFDGVLDGLIYGALVGFGFAMTENFFYFFGAFSDGGIANLTTVIVLRAVVFGLNHAFFTALTGIGLGLARNTPRLAMRILYFVAGLSAAILAHSIHNFGASVAGINGVGILLSLAVAGCSIGLLLITVFLSWQHERECIRRELVQDVGTLLTEREFAQLTGPWRRPLFKSKRRRQGDDRLQLCVEIALRQHRLKERGANAEPGLAQEIDRLRTLLTTAIA